MQFSTLFLISLFSVSIALTGCVGSDNSTASTKPNQPAKPDVTNPDDTKPDDNSDGNNSGENSGDNNNNGNSGSNDNGSGDGSTGGDDLSSPPFSPDAVLTECEYTTTNSDVNLLEDGNKETNYDLSDYQQLSAEANNDLTGTWVMVSKKNVDFGELYGITQVWEKSFFIIRNASENFDNTQVGFEIASCNTNAFSPVSYYGSYDSGSPKADVLIQSEITPASGSIEFEKISNTELIEYQHQYIAAKAIKISSSTSPLGTNANNKASIEGTNFDSEDIWCISQSRKVTNINKTENQCAATDSSQLFISLESSSSYSEIDRRQQDGVDHADLTTRTTKTRFTTLQSSEYIASILLAEKKTKLIKSEKSITSNNDKDKEEGDGDDVKERIISEVETTKTDDFIISINGETGHDINCNSTLIDMGASYDDFIFDQCSIMGGNFDVLATGTFSINIKIPKQQSD